ncbi:hypothetical protein BH09BAC4_BH09BAC4_24910 [soil metagenome]
MYITNRAPKVGDIVCPKTQISVQRIQSWKFSSDTIYFGGFMPNAQFRVIEVNKDPYKEDGIWFKLKPFGGDTILKIAGDEFSPNFWILIDESSPT